MAFIRIPHMMETLLKESAGGKIKVSKNIVFYRLHIALPKLVVPVVATSAPEIFVEIFAGCSWGWICRKQPFGHRQGSTLISAIPAHAAETENDATTYHSTISDQINRHHPNWHTCCIKAAR
jgi:hypothetical protein